MPNTRLILHVKGTQSETAELPREVIRNAISSGQLTHSQLIWSPAHNSWKQARELPEVLPDEPLILHVKGTESETTQLSKEAVKAGLAEGKIAHSQLIWVPGEQAWKQVRELPDLLPSQKLAPAPSRVETAPVAQAVAAVIPESPTSPVARVATASGATPQVKVATVGMPKVRVATAAAAPQVRAGTAPAMQAVPRAAGPKLVVSTGSLEVEEEEGFHLFKWIFMGMGALILLILGANYVMVDEPLVANMGQTSFSTVPVYAHFGAFMQPNVMVIHILPSEKITPDNLPKFLIELARSTPQNPITHDLFTRVALTSGWTAQYSFSGYSWKELGDMGRDDPDQRKEFLLAQMGDAGGQSLMPETTLNEQAQQIMRDNVWRNFVAKFAPGR